MEKKKVFGCARDVAWDEGQEIRSRKAVKENGNNMEHQNKLNEK